MKNLTKAQEKTLRFMFNTYIETGEMPTYAKMDEDSGVKISTIHKRIDALIEKGYVVKLYPVGSGYQPPVLVIRMGIAGDFKNGTRIYS